MDTIYISHPYTGNEKANRKVAIQIAKDLADKFPDTLFINPLSVLVHLKDSKIPYETVLKQCKELLGKCDGLILAGNWKDSYGCMEEYLYAASHNMPIWEKPEDFDGGDKMPKDCCGTHAACENCHCRKCVHRLECWNCNECTQDVDQEYPVGYTGGNVWKCSRYLGKE